MAKDGPTKMIGVKNIGSNEPTQTVPIAPGTTAADVLNKLGKAGVGYQLSDSQNPKKVFKPTDVLYALLEDGSLIHCSALVDAGGRYAGQFVIDAVVGVAMIVAAVLLISHQASTSLPGTSAIYYGGGDTPRAIDEVSHGRPA